LGKDAREEKDGWSKSELRRKEQIFHPWELRAVSNPPPAPRKSNRTQIHSSGLLAVSSEMREKQCSNFVVFMMHLSPSTASDS
jgi:hypothetical protein